MFFIEQIGVKKVDYHTSIKRVMISLKENTAFSLYYQPPSIIINKDITVNVTIIPPCEQ